MSGKALVPVSIRYENKFYGFENEVKIPVLDQLTNEEREQVLEYAGIMETIATQVIQSP